jgi:hypothetical protein
MSKNKFADVSHGTVDTDSDDAEPRSRKKSKISQRENDGYSTEGDDKRKLEEEIKRLKEKLASQKSSAAFPPAVNVTNNTIRHSSFEALQKFNNIPKCDAGAAISVDSLSSPYRNCEEDKMSSCHSESPRPHTAGQDVKDKGPSTGQTITHGASPSLGYKVQPKSIELVPGYGVFLTQKQLDMAIDGAKNSPTRLIRNLMSVFFSPQTLATSSACGTRKHKALDSDIVQACIHYVRSQFQHVSKSTLVDCINDKCANYRRKQ